jgi:hypothetical protein
LNSKWEYHTQQFDYTYSPQQVDNVLNDLGQDCWELVTITDRGLAVFKRQIETEDTFPNE